MNDLVPVAQGRYSELDFVRVQRDVPRATPIERVAAGAYRQRYLAALILAVALLIGAYFALTARPEYTAIASVQLDQQAPRILSDPDLDPQTSAQDAERFLQTQLDHVRSRSIAENVAARVQLTPPVLDALGVSQDSSNLREQAIAKLQDNVDAQLGLNTRLARISFTSYDRNVSANLANAFAEALAESNVTTKMQLAARAKQYLMGQLAAAKSRLETSERQMLSYARAADLTTTVVPGGAEDKGGSLRAQQLGLMTDSLAQATARRVDAQQQWRQVSGASPMNLPEVQNNQAVQGLLAQRAQAQAALQEERQRHTDNYPSVREAQAKIAELDQQISGIASNIKTSFLGRYVAAAQQEQQMRQTVAQLQGAAMAERERSVRYNSLQREVDTNKAFYDGLLQRYKEVAAASGAPSANVTIVDRAGPPMHPSSAGAVRSLALASMGGLILALLLGSMRDRMHNVVRTCEDIEGLFNVPCLGVIPRVAKNISAREALDNPRSPQTEAYHSVAVALEHAAADVLPKTLLVTSSTGGEGKSTTALALARSLTALGRKVLLIDTDLRRASASNRLSPPDRPGLSQALEGSAQPEETIGADEHGYDLVQAGDMTGSPIPLLSTNHVKSVLGRLTSDYDIVILDGPPIMGLADSVLLARSVEAVLVVVEANRVHSSQLDLAISRLPEDRIIGAVLTKFDARTAGVRYGGHDYYMS